jgi:alkanesulfonate monooxygenase SsuD/methylene tetrahydromethanopterin reductase-like flavin-dependent oxidoreductase (luciferase family)
VGVAAQWEVWAVKVGVTLFFQNIPDFLQRAKAADYSEPAPVADSICFSESLRLADLVEPLGFDTLWTIEHHFGPYGMSCNPLQIFSYMAGRTTRIGFGTMVIVLPWHDPIRVAEGITVLDNMLAGRRLMLGLGRGAAENEFAGFRVDYAESRDRMDEALEIVRLALTQEWFSFEGRFFTIPRTSIRPRPVTPDLTENMVFAWSSPETMAWAANTGGGQLYANFSNWEAVASSSAAFNSMRAEHGWHWVPPIAGGPVFCSTSRADVATARDWFKQTFDSSVWHYGLMNKPSLRALLAGKEGAELERAIAAIYDEATRVGVFGTPNECREQLGDIQARTGMGELVCHMNFGLMPVDVAEGSMRLFAAEVLPTLQSIDVPDIRATPYAETGTVHASPADNPQRIQASLQSTAPTRGG